MRGWLGPVLFGFQQWGRDNSVAQAPSLVVHWPLGCGFESCLSLVAASCFVSEITFAANLTRCAYQCENSCGCKMKIFTSDMLRQLLTFLRIHVTSVQVRGLFFISFHLTSCRYCLFSLPFCTEIVVFARTARVYIFIYIYIYISVCVCVFVYCLCTCIYYHGNNLTNVYFCNYILLDQTIQAINYYFLYKVIY